MPIDNTGDGKDQSPKLELEGLSGEAVSMAVIMDDVDVPWAGSYTHWVIGDIPPQAVIPPSIPQEETVVSLGGAIQDMAYGKTNIEDRILLFGAHRYQFHVFVLDAYANVNAASGKQI